MIDALILAARQAVERYVFIGDGNAYCWTSIVDFTPMPIFVLERPTPPACPLPEGIAE